MALGFSGSGGGITYPLKKVENYTAFIKNAGEKFNLRYVDYFINNVCNLRCKHCYVNYQNEDNDLTVEEWQKVFDSCINLGARVFGNVGKEPLITWDETKSILSYFKNKREKDDRIKFGIVTNGLLIDSEKAEELNELNLDYIDISIDGTQNTHDKIRGEGAYNKTIQNISRLTKTGLQDKIFISYTLNKLNLNSFPELLQELYSLGITNYLVSPYLTNDSEDELELTNQEYVNFVKNLLQSLNLSKYKNIDIHIRNDFTSLKYQNELLKQKIINTEKLVIDNNDALYYIYNLGDNKIIFNVQTWNPDFWYAARISHDGYVSNCLDMSYENYPERAIGNIREQSVRSILENVNVYKASLAV